MRIRQWFVTALLIGAVLLGGCSSQGSSPTASPSAAATTAQASPAPVATPTPANTPTSGMAGLRRLQGKATIEMVVKGSAIVIEVNGDDAPVTAGNFVDLVNQGVYNGLAFHRVIRQPEPFVVQGGDPQSKDPNFPIAQLGTGGYTDPATNAPRYIPLEIKPEGATEPIYGQTLADAGVSDPPVLKHERGAVAMARSQFPDSASSQFYFALADLAFLDGSYAVFGKVTSGMEVVDQIEQGDRIETAKVTAGLENLQAAQ
ncbi:MAG: peptidylprolyl isomerase [Oculatellaceae cyanobacterium bins.114]|nr:peptidylprolyl isomerase [Oculatellaceae cyanobacterium bins.114]